MLRRRENWQWKHSRWTRQHLAKRSVDSPPRRMPLVTLVVYLSTAEWRGRPRRWLWKMWLSPRARSTQSTLSPTHGQTMHVAGCWRWRKGECAWWEGVECFAEGPNWLHSVAAALPWSVLMTTSSAVQCSAMQFLCDTWKMDLCTYLQRGGLQRPRSAKSAAWRTMRYSRIKTWWMMVGGKEIPRRWILVLDAKSECQDSSLNNNNDGGGGAAPLV